jgi:histidinol phosphatase-like enzyme (inositol monophosphatase family)
MELSKAETADIMAVAGELADSARVASLRHFRTAALLADSKEAVRFDPVTQGDREAEQAMREILARRRPSDGILGEEYEGVASRSGLTWVLDPIDGTRGFLSGVPTWGVLVALCAGETPLYGVIDQPYIGERFSGGFGTASVTGPMGARALGTRAPRVLGDALMLSTFPEIGTAAEHAAFRRVADRVRLVRYGTDCYGYALVAAGCVDLVIEAGLQPYDVAAPIAVVQAAGGIVTDWQGRPCPQGGQVIAAANAEIHAAALALLNG